VTDRTWRLGPELPGPVTGPVNMAIDRALLDTVADGAPPTVRFYRWSPATLSFGRNQPARGLYDEAAARERGIAFVRRPTGGQAVLHDDELTYAVVAPISAVGKPRAAYRRINEAIVDGLRRLGVRAAVAGSTVPTAGGVGGHTEGHDWAAACFRTPERGEVVARGRKLVGSAQRTHRRTVLQHGSILLGGSQAPAEALRLDPVPLEGGAGWTTVEGELGRRPALDAVAGALVTGFETVLGIQLAASSLSVEERRESDRWTERFASPEWTWRR
jgi:lipoate-protein ligase A